MYLNGEPYTRAGSPITSFEAAKKAKLGKERLQIEVLETLAEHGPQIDDELLDRIQARHDREVVRNSVGSRRDELKAAGFVEATGVRRPNRRGNNCAEHQITSLGRDYLQARLEMRKENV